MDRVTPMLRRQNVKKQNRIFFGLDNQTEVVESYRTRVLHSTVTVYRSGPYTWERKETRWMEWHQHQLIKHKHGIQSFISWKGIFLKNHYYLLQIYINIYLLTIYIYILIKLANILSWLHFNFLYHFYSVNIIKYIFVYMWSQQLLNNLCISIGVA